MTGIPNTLSLSLPSWVVDFSVQYHTTKELAPRMAFVIAAARENIKRRTGGPFAAAVFDEVSGNLLALGVNLVTHENLAMAHAEMLALSLAQRQLHRFSLQTESTNYQLVTSSEPCAMCLGAICWSGLSSLVCGASSDDARAIGFDEGPIHQNWQTELLDRGIKVTTGMLKEDASRVLRDYRNHHGIIYNGSATEG